MDRFNNSNRREKLSGVVGGEDSRFNPGQYSRYMITATSTSKTARTVRQSAGQYSNTFSFLQVSPVFYKPVRPPDTFANLSQPQPTITPSSFTAEQTNELMFLYDRLRLPEFRRSVVNSLPRLLHHLTDDNVFIRLIQLERLPDITDEDESGSVYSGWSWGRSDRRRANQSLMESILSVVANIRTMTATAFILAIKFLHAYKCITNREAAENSPVTSSPYSNESFSPLFSHMKSTFFFSKKEDTVENECQLLVLGLMIANKYTEDRPHGNRAWSNISGIPVEKLNSLEQIFLRKLGHEVFVRENEFKEWILCLSRLLEWIPTHQRLLWAQPCMSRQVDSGWLSLSRFAQYVRRTSRDEGDPKGPSTQPNHQTLANALPRNQMDKDSRSDFK